MPTRNHEFKIALSFSGERRRFVKKVAAILAAELGEGEVFYDHNHLASLADSALKSKIGNVFQHSKMVVPIICKDYLKSPWCIWEWENIFERRMNVDADPSGVMYLRYENTEIQGKLRLSGHVDIDKFSAKKVADLILTKYRELSGEGDSPWSTKPQGIECHTGNGTLLPPTSGHCFGREPIIELLNNAWESATTNVVTIFAWGGVGKTTVIKEWLKLFEKSGEIDAKRIYSYSFSNQGINQKENASITSEPFLRAALQWFGVEDEKGATPESKAIRLANAIREKRSLLILDGLDPLQRQLSFNASQYSIQDAGARHLIIALAKNNPGLCVITTRFPIYELKEYTVEKSPKYVEKELDELPIEAGVRLLIEEGATNSTKEELDKAVVEWGRHAFSLMLLASYVKYRFKGDIRYRDRTHSLIDSTGHGHTERILGSYEEVLKNTPELKLLHILSIFSGPATKESILSIAYGSGASYKQQGRNLWRALRSFPYTSRFQASLQWLGIKIKNHIRRAKSPHAIESLRNMFPTKNGQSFDETLEKLRELRLVQRPSETGIGFNGHDEGISCHPLIQDYFRKTFKKNSPDEWAEAHSRLFDYFLSLPRDEQPAKNEEMEPLYSAIPHGCYAGRYTEAGLVYYRRLIRGAAYSCNDLGNLDADLALMSYFFNHSGNTTNGYEGYGRPANGLTRRQKTLLLHWTSVLLFTRGRYRDAIEPSHQALALGKKYRAWWIAATNGYYRGAAYLAFGDFDKALSEALESVIYAKKARDPLSMVGPRATLGRILHQMGRFEQAREEFKLSEEAMRLVTPEVKYLHSVWSYWFCELLVDIGDFGEAEERSRQALKVALIQPRLAQGKMLDTAVSELSLAKTLMCNEVASSCVKDNESIEYMRKAINSIEKVGHLWLKPDALLANSDCFRMCGRFDDAQQSLNDDDELLVNRDNLKLHEVDKVIRSLELAISMNKLDNLGMQLDDCARSVELIGYHRYDVKLLLLQARMGSLDGDQSAFRAKINTAKERADEIGGFHWLIDATEKEFFAGTNPARNNLL